MSTPIFTKRHYRLIARAIYEAIGRAPTSGEAEKDREAARWAARNAAAVLRGTNPNFDEARFVEACLDGCDVDRRGTQFRNPIR